MRLWFFSLSVFAGALFLFGHLVYTRGLRRALVFSIFCLAVMVDKEASQGRTHIPDYVVHGNFPKVFGASVVVVLGWYFAFVCSLYLAERILAAWRSRPPGPVMLAALILPIVAFFSLAMEMTGIAMGWWSWSDMRGMIPLSEASASMADMVPYFVRIGSRMTAWAFHALIVFLPYLLLEETALRDRIRNWLKPILTIVYIISLYILTNLTGHADLPIIVCVLTLAGLALRGLELKPPSTYFISASSIGEAS